MQKNKLSEFVLITFIATILSVTITWPFAAHLATFYTDQGDYALGGSVLWYNQDAIKSGKIFDQEEYFQGYQFYPQPTTLAFSNNMVVPSFIFTPIFTVTNNLGLSVNIFALLTLILTFITAYYAINYFVKNSYASIIGAAIFTFNPQTMVRFPHHIDVMNRYFIPLIFLFGYQFLNKPSFKSSFIFFLTFTLNALSVTYYMIFSLILLPLASLPFLWKNYVQSNWEYFKNLFRFALIGLIFLPLLWYFQVPYLEFSQKEGASRSASYSTFFSARIFDWLVPGPDNLIYSSFTKAVEPLRNPKDDRDILNYEEHTLFVNILPLILFILGWKVFKQQKLNHGYFYIILIASFLFTFGPFFMGNGNKPLFPMPLNLFYQFMPFLEGIRGLSRFEFVMFLPLAIIASFGVVRLMKKSTKYQIGLIIIFLAIICLENLGTKQYNQQSHLISQALGVDSNILEKLKDKKVLHLPVFNTTDADNFGNNSGYLNWLTVTKERSVNGNAAYLPADQLKLLDEVNAKLDEDSFKKLKILGVDYVVVHKSLIPDYDKKYAPLDHFYDFGKVFENNDLMVLDLQKYQINYTLCDFKDFVKEIKPVMNEEFLMTGYGLSVKNPGNCFLPFLGEERYQKMSTNVDGEKKIVYFRMPILIGPMEEIVLTQMNKEMRIE